MWTRVLTPLLVLTLLLGACSPFAADDVAEAPRAEPAAPDFVDDGLDAEGAVFDEDGRAARGANVELILAATTRKIVRNASVELFVEDPDEAVAQIGDLARRVGGFVSNADLRRQPGGELRGTLTIRVPATELDRTLEELADMAISEEARTITTDDVTGEYQDLQARLANLRAFETELLALLETVRQRDDARADNLLAVFERIRQVRDEIERIQARLDGLDEMVALSTVHIHLRTPPAPAVIGGEPGVWRPLEVIAAAARSLLTALQALATVAIWFALFVVPLAVLLGAPVVASLVWLRRWRRRGAVADL
jgi:hypothetical protein